MSICVWLLSFHKSWHPCACGCAFFPQSGGSQAQHLQVQPAFFFFFLVIFVDSLSKCEHPWENWTVLWGGKACNGFCISRSGNLWLIALLLAYLGSPNGSVLLQGICMCDWWFKTSQLWVWMPSLMYTLRMTENKPVSGEVFAFSLVFNLFERWPDWTISLI